MACSTKHSTAFTLLLLSLGMASSGREATLLYQNQHNAGKCPQHLHGIWLSDLATGGNTRLYDRAVTGSCFSPDGRDIAFVVNDSLYIMRNDGTDIRGVIGGNQWWTGYRELFAVNVLRWTTRGIFWVADNHLFRYLTTENRVDTVLELTRIGNVCEQGMVPVGETDPGGTVEKSIIHMSSDGSRMWTDFTLSPASYDNVHVSANQQWWLDDKGETVDVLDCNIHRRGVHAFVQFAPDYSRFDVVWDSQWGHGDAFTADGHCMLVGFGYHRPLCIYDRQEGAVVDSISSWQNKWDPPYPDGFEARPVEQVINNDSLYVAFSICRPDKGACIEGPTRCFLVNWRTDERVGEFGLKDVPSWTTEYSMLPAQVWDGALPVVTTAPYMRADKSELIFVTDGATIPAAKTVVVVNAGVGTLGPLTATVSPQSGWLTVSPDENGGDTQTVANAIEPSRLTSDISQATVTLTGGGASNEISYTVTAYKGSAIAAPSGLTAAASGDSLLDVTLTWVDNAINESGYCVERKGAGGEFAEIGRTGSNAEMFTDMHRGYGETCVYRVRAYTSLGGSEQYSGYSNEQQITIEGVPWIRLVSPLAGDSIKAGSVAVVRWESNLVDNVYIEYSPDGSESYQVVTASGGIVSSAPDWQHFEWTTPLVETNDAYVRVVQYGNPSQFASAGPITISEDVAVSSRPRSAVANMPYSLQVLEEGALAVRSHTSTALRVTVCTAQGRIIVRETIASHTAKSITGLSAGFYLVSITNVHGAGVGSQRVLVSGHH